MLGRLIASQIACASVASVLLLFTYGFTNCGAIAGLHTDLTAWLDVALELRDPAAPLQPLAPHRPLGAIHTVYLKDLLGQVHTHASKLHDDPSSFRDW
jgi:hypothetical protein